MKIARTLCTLLSLCLFFSFSSLSVAQTADPLPSWNNVKSKQSIIDFVAQVTTKGSPNFVPRSERIATFDNDGNLWAEQPMYAQLFFAAA